MYEVTSVQEVKKVGCESILRTWVMLIPSLVGSHGGSPGAHYVSTVRIIIKDSDRLKVGNKIRSMQDRSTNVLVLR